MLVHSICSTSDITMLYSKWQGKKRSTLCCLLTSKKGGNSKLRNYLEAISDVQKDAFMPPPWSAVMMTVNPGVGGGLRQAPLSRGTRRLEKKLPPPPSGEMSDFEKKPGPRAVAGGRKMPTKRRKTGRRGRSRHL